MTVLKRRKQGGIRVGEGVTSDEVTGDGGDRVTK
jgi:hypothetical protein